MKKSLQDVLREQRHNGETHVACESRIDQLGGKAQCCYCVPHDDCELTGTSKDSFEVVENLDINVYPRAITSPMAAFEIAVGEFENSSKSEYFFKKLRIARLELAKAMVAYADMVIGKNGWEGSEHDELRNLKIKIENDLRAEQRERNKF